MKINLQIKSGYSLLRGGCDCAVRLLVCLSAPLSDHSLLNQLAGSVSQRDIKKTVFQLDREKSELFPQMKKCKKNIIAC